MRIGIIGGGESGVGAALLALKVGDEPYVSDYGQINPVYRQNLIENSVRFEESGHNFDILVTSDLIVKSPGVRDNTPIVLSLKAQGLTVISELEYGARHCKGKIIAITGSNGKTTTTNLTHHMLVTAGLDAVKGGNLGTCLSSLLLERDHDVYVLEVSSFQLDGIVGFRPDVSILINITPDHLDRYDYNFDLYAESKMRISMNQMPDDYFIYGSDSDVINSKLSLVDAMKIPVSVKDLGIDGISDRNPFLRGRHNKVNAGCAIEAVRLLGVLDDHIKKAISTFKNDDHRLQTVAKINDVEWINDSKATNVDAVFYALDAIDDPIVWIVGGVDKGNDYSELLELVRSKVKVMICLGVDNQKLIETFDSMPLEIIQTQSMEEAIRIADDHVVGGDVVLLSPACASFDLFKNYKDRGNQFVSGVWKLLRKRR